MSEKKNATWPHKVDERAVFFLRLKKMIEKFVRK